MHVDDEILSGDDRIVTDTVHKLKQQFLMKKVHHLINVGDGIEILGRESVKDRNMETCTLVSTHSLQVTGKALAEAE